MGFHLRYLREKNAKVELRESKSLAKKMAIRATSMD